MSLVANRYAEALISIAAQQDAIDTFLKDLGMFTEMYSNEPGFKDFLLNPQSKTSIKKSAVNNAFNGNIRADIISFVSLLLDKGRIKHLPDINKEFAKLADEKRGILKIKIISATSLDDGQIKIITDKYKKLYSAASAKAIVEVDASLMGGVILYIGDKVIDASVKGRLIDLQGLLTK